MVTYIPHWCLDCGTEMNHPDCGIEHVFKKCSYCGRIKRFINDKYEAVRHLRNRRDVIAHHLGDMVGVETLEEIRNEKTLQAAISTWEKKVTGAA